jgi:hypothetical protein
MRQDPEKQKYGWQENQILQTVKCQSRVSLITGQNRLSLDGAQARKISLLTPLNSLQETLERLMKQHTSKFHSAAK